MELIRETKSLKSKITSIRKRGKTLDTDIHLAAVSCAYHVQQHGDTTLMSSLVDAMPKSSRRKSLMVWIEAHFPMTVNRETGLVKVRKDRKSEDFLIEAASATPFWDFSKEREPTAITVDSIRSYLKRIQEGGSEKRPADDEAKRIATDLLASFPTQVAAG